MLTTPADPDPDPASGADVAAPGVGGPPAADAALSPKVVLFWRIPNAIGTALLLLLALSFAAAATGVPVALRVLVPTVVLLGGVVSIVWWPGAAYRRWRYAVTDDGVELRHGVLIHHESSIPHYRVQHIDVQQGPLDRWRGVVKLSISTASPATDATIPGIEPGRADALRTRILARAEADDGV